MDGEKLSPLERTVGSEPSYFEVQAYMGTTKHMGGLDATEELVELCGIGEDTYVLDVGCGVGATACHLAKRHAARVLGVDISGEMIDWAKRRAKREGVEHGVEFRVADAQSLPFESALFDVVISESVLSFIEDKRRALGECVRVVKPGGWVGLNEETWVQTPVPAELVAGVARIWDIRVEIPSADGWETLLASAGLRDVVARPYRFDARRESSQVRRYRLEDMVRMLTRTLSLYLKRPAFRRYMRGRRSLPQGLFAYLGYGIYAGRR